jgi:GMP synthase-like glutamine amidotransferase
VTLAVVEQQADAPAGLLGAWARERGIEVRTLRAPELGAWPDPRTFAAVAALGSDRSVARSRDPWIADQVAFLGDAHAAGVPVLGVCFGAQALAAALGAAVDRAPQPEIGWVGLPEAEERLRGPWFAWHEDAFTLPDGAEELARTAAGVHAFRAGRSLGVQFHPEVTPAIVESWIADDRGSLAAARIDPAILRKETARRGPAARSQAFTLFDHFAGSWTLS